MSKQLEVLQCIINYTVERGYPPTNREICNMAHLKSTSSVHSHIQNLKDKGLLLADEDTDGHPRAIRIPGYQFVRVEETSAVV